MPHAHRWVVIRTEQRLVGKRLVTYTFYKCTICGAGDLRIT